MDFGLTGRRVVIVGAHRGIGLELAKAVRGQGCDVVVTSENPEVFAARDRLNEHDDGSRPVEASRFDITDRRQVEEAFWAIGSLDVLVANAGLFARTPATDTSAESAEMFTRQVEVNLIGLRHCAVAAAPRMKDGGRIIFTGSIWAKVGGPGYGAYTASKHGVIGLAKSLAMDLGPRGISVNAVNPGSMATDMNLKELSDELKAALKQQMWLRPGLIEPEKLAGAYLFLASDAATEITGQSITVDRGQVIAGGG